MLRPIVADPLAPVERDAAVLDEHPAVAHADLRGGAVEPGPIEVDRRATGPQAQVLRAGPERQPGGADAAERRGVLGRAGRLGRVAFGRCPEAGRLGLGEVGHPRQEVVDERELLRRVAADLLLRRALERLEQRLDGRHPLGHDLDDDAPAVGRVGRAPDVAGLLEPVDDAGDGARGQAHQLGQLAGGRGAGVDQQLERVDVRLAETEPDGDRLAEDRSLEVDAPEGPDDAVDALSLVHLDNCSSVGNYLRCADNDPKC